MPKQISTMHKLLLSWIFLLTALIFKTHCQDFVVDNDTDELQYAPSKAVPKQIALYNGSSHVGVIVDIGGERVAVFNEGTGLGVIIDNKLRTGVQIDQGAWIGDHISLQDYLLQANLSLLYDQNPSVFQLDKQGPLSPHTVRVKKQITEFSPSFWEIAVADIKNDFDKILKSFDFIIRPLKFVIGRVLDLAHPAWVVFKGGIVALVNVLKWMCKLLMSAVGGIPALIKLLITFKLSLIIAALDGAKRFFVILKELVEKISLINILKAILIAPALITKFIVGLGGKIIRGITGIFSLIAKLFTFSIYALASAVKAITKMILAFLMGKRVTHQDVAASVDELLTVPEMQQRIYPTPGADRAGDFEKYQNFLQSVKGEGNYKIHGIPVGAMVRAVTETSSSAKGIVTNVLGIMNPLLPFKQTMPHLLINMVKSLNTTKGPSYVEQIIPSLKVPRGGMSEVADMLHSGESEESIEILRNLPAPEMLKKIPVVSQIYAELDDATRHYQNTSLDSLLQSHHISELVEFTTQSLGLI